MWWSVCVVCFVLIGEAGRTSDCSQQCDRRGKPGPGPTQTPSSHVVRRRLRTRTCRFDRLRCVHSDGNMIWDWFWHVLKSCLFFVQMEGQKLLLQRICLQLSGNLDRSRHRWKAQVSLLLRRTVRAMTHYSGCLLSSKCILLNSNSSPYYVEVHPERHKWVYLSDVGVYSFNCFINYLITDSYLCVSILAWCVMTITWV